MSQSMKNLLKVVITMVLSLVIGAIFIISIGENPIAEIGRAHV